MDTPRLSTILFFSRNNKRPLWWETALCLAMRNKNKNHLDSEAPELRLPSCINVLILQYLFKEAVIAYGGFASPQELARFYPVYPTYACDAGLSVYTLIAMTYQARHVGAVGRIAYDNSIMTGSGRVHAAYVLHTKHLTLYEQRLLAPTCIRLFYRKPDIPFLRGLYDPEAYRIAGETGLGDYVAAIPTVMVEGREIPDPKHLDYVMKLVFYMGGFCGFVDEVYKAALQEDLVRFIPYSVWGHYKRGLTFHVPYFAEREHLALLGKLSRNKKELAIYETTRTYWEEREKKRKDSPL